MVAGADYSRLAAAEFSVGFLLNGGLRQRRVPSPSHWLGCYWFCSSKGCGGLLRFLRRAPFKKSGRLPNLRRNFLERWLMWLILARMTSTSKEAPFGILAEIFGGAADDPIYLPVLQPPHTGGPFRVHAQALSSAAGLVSSSARFELQETTINTTGSSKRRT
ncbi:hypothetical protein OsI_02006 [Oryza sativa Indica Group]|uniref:Uncharacterized protein n=1 Tax=Oryza sativa subsp. indica TaxID=39946 RepID=A2WQ78_ORYSI|nr:hypothetical protein OsI_02006 [Oryza sativa Indica Group]